MKIKKRWEALIESSNCFIFSFFFFSLSEFLEHEKKPVVNWLSFYFAATVAILLYCKVMVAFFWAAILGYAGDVHTCLVNLVLLWHLAHMLFLLLQL